MKKLQPQDYSRLMNVQSDAMNDVCNIHHITLSSGTYSTKITRTDVIVSGVACGIRMINGQLQQAGQTVFVTYDALLRIPANVTVTITDEIELVEKGVLVVSGTFKPQSIPAVNSSVQHIPLKRTVA
jgi:hypothetical protein